MIKITVPAQEHFKKLLLSQAKGTQIRVFVMNPGTNKAECGVSYCPPNTVSLTDIKLQFEKFSTYIDEISAPWLENAEIDLVVDKLGSQLILNAPKVKTSKFTDDTPLIERVEYLLNTKINPQLAAHGGHVKLVEITDQGYAILKFSGGCNGCSMVKLTLKEHIEIELLQSFSELKGVQDFTEHQRGIHSYY
ncbi:MAG: Fe-S biogenesis protein NfuA [Candidatus Dasytiphilus stammeri]